MLFLVYLCAISFISFLLFGTDKKRAIDGKWRIPEAVLLSSAALGGSIGAFVGMYAFHHKLRKSKFSFGIPVILILQIIILIIILNI